MEKTLAQIAAK